MAEQHKCIQCGLTAAEVPTMVKLANGSCICGKCIEEVRSFAAEVAESSGAEVAMPAGAATPKSLVSFLDDYVVGQSDAKKTLAIAVYNHYKRLKHQGDVEITKSNILMLGPTGTGKTLLAQSIARMLDVPFTIADATSLTQAGYVGDDVETILQRLLQAADGDVAKAERGIVFIDEIDKLAAAKAGPSITRDVSGEGVQQALLKLIEGARVSVQATGNRKTPGAQVDYIDTKNILFICAGAFVSLLDSIKKPIASQGMGFCSKEKKAEAREVTPELLFEHGMIPEFVGRLPVIATLEDLDVAALERILVEPKNAVVRQMQSLFAMDGADLRFEDGSIAAIASQAYKLKTGARGARSILEKLLKEALYEVPGSEGAVVTVGADLKVSVRYQEALAA